MENNEASHWELKTLVGIALIAGIYLAQPVLFPLLMAFFLYLLLSPVMDLLLRFKCPAILAAMLIVLTALTLISTGISSFVGPAVTWVQQGPKNIQLFEKKFSGIKKSLNQINETAKKAENIATLQKKEGVILASESTSISSLFDLTSSVILLILTILIFLFFFLIYFKHFFHNLKKFTSSRKKIPEEDSLITALQQEISTYMFTFTLICMGLGTIIGIMLSLFSVPNAYLWGIMAIFLTYIPYLGHVVGISVVFFVCFLTFDNYFQIFGPPLFYLLITALEGQVITPILLGNRLDLNPLLVLFSIFFWGGLWGISGIIISVPLLVMLRLICEHVPALSSYKVILEK